MPDNLQSPKYSILDQLLQSVAAGNPVALERLYRLTKAKLFGVCLRICKNEDVAAEILQECYVKIWRRADSFRVGQASPMSWLIAIARNSAIDWRRQQPAKAALDVDALADIADDSVDIAGAAEQAEESDDLRYCLRKIDQKNAPVIKQIYLDGLSYAEVASAVNKPLGTVKSLVSRGLKQLKSCINNLRQGMAS